MNEVLFIDATEELQALAEEAKQAGFHVSTASLDESERLLAGGDAFDAVVANLARWGDTSSAQRLLRSPSLLERTARLAVVQTDQVAALDPELPVDDFVPLPGAPGEFVARLRRAVRRRSGSGDSNVLRCGPLTIDQASYQVYLGSRSIDLTYKEYELLRFLAQNQDRVCTRETLLSRVWGYDFYGGARTVDVHVRRLRSKIDDADHSLIETVRNVGYRLRAS